MSVDHDSGEAVAIFAPDLKKIDVVNAGDFFDRLRSSMKGGKRLVLDLSSVQFIDSSGLGKIVTALRSYREEGGELRICGVQPPVQILFSMVRLGEIVGIDDDAESSSRALGGSAAGDPGR